MSKACDFAHQPVMPEETLQGLNVRQDGCYVDCTLGGAGHAAAIAGRLGPGGRLIGIDQDPEARQAAGAKLALLDTPARIDLIDANFADLDVILDRLGLSAVEGILADLGVSSWQLDKAERGFSYHQDGPLDMRMDPANPLTAAIAVNTWPEAELVRVLRAFGEERYAGRISQAIVRRRGQQPFSRTLELAETVAAAMPAGPPPMITTSYAFI